MSLISCKVMILIRNKHRVSITFFCKNVSGGTLIFALCLQILIFQSIKKLYFDPDTLLWVVNLPYILSHVCRDCDIFSAGQSLHS